MSRINIINTFVISLIFIILTLFFYHVGPFLPWNGDDWRYLGLFRSPIPSTAIWNPARIFPEVLMPFIGTISAFLVFPIIGNYIDSIQLCSAITLSFFITLLCYAIFKLIKLFTKSNNISLFSMLFFIVFSFFIFCNPNSMYLFYSETLTLLYYYTIPYISNSILIIFIIIFQIYKRLNISKLSYALLILVIYFIQFSMTVASLLGASFAGTVLLFRVISYIHNKQNIKVIDYIKYLTQFDYLLLIIILFWIIAALFDMNGMRYAWHLESPSNFMASIKNLYHLILKIRFESLIICITCILLSLITIVLSFINIYISYDKTIYNFILILGLISFSFFIYFTITMSISLRISWNAGSIFFMFGIFFYYIFITTICIAFILCKLTIVANFIISFFMIFIIIETFRSDFYWNKYSLLQKSIVSNWIDTTIAADCNNSDANIIVYSDEKWPHPNFMKDVLSDTLQHHNLIKKHVKINFIRKNPDEITSSLSN